jgi:hypothetical protein
VDLLTTDYVVGLDVGRTCEFTALAAVERTRPTEPEGDVRPPSCYAVRHLERFTPGTPYTEVVARLGELFGTPPLKGARLLVDVTAVGEPVLRMLRRAGLGARLQAVTITAGLGSGRGDRGIWQVAKVELASTMQVLMQERRLKIAEALPDAELLMKELANFQVEPVLTGNDELMQWREGVHDDLVLAIGIAAWECERRGTVPFRLVRL